MGGGNKKTHSDNQVERITGSGKAAGHPWPTHQAGSRPRSPGEAGKTLPDGQRESWCVIHCGSPVRDSLQSRIISKGGARMHPA